MTTFNIFTLWNIFDWFFIKRLVSDICVNHPILRMTAYGRKKRHCITVHLVCDALVRCRSGAVHPLPHTPRLNVNLVCNFYWSGWLPIRRGEDGVKGGGGEDSYFSLLQSSLYYKVWKLGVRCKYSYFSHRIINSFPRI